MMAFATPNAVPLEDPDPCCTNEAIYRDGVVIGYLTSGNYGHHLGGAIGLGYVKCSVVGETAEAQLNSHYQIDVAGKLFDADVSLRSFYDPKALQVKLDHEYRLGRQGG